MSNPSRPSATVPSVLSARASATGARRGRRVAQVIFFGALVWVIASGSAQILAEGLFAKRVPRDANACRSELVALRARLADASLIQSENVGELAAVTSFRKTLGGEAGRAWDIRAQDLIDGCPPAESSAAYALARLRAAHEAMVRIDAQQVAPARDAHRRSALPVAAPQTP